MTQFDTQDYYFLQAKKNGFKARSAFKLQEINERLALIKPNSIILDLGCAPGSWLQYAGKFLGKEGAILGVDLTEVNLDMGKKNVRAVVDDCFSLTPERVSEYMAPLVKNFSHFNLVLSDMAPKTSGIKHADHIKSLNLSMRALEMAALFLKPGGHTVIKVFSGGENHELISAARKIFKQVKQMRPQSVRSVSREFYVVGLHKK